ncbi:hypothetical protein VZT92_014750 [Zoarces viviparus]|uniref:Uncharacterized protein n=1 Tax=Zoarces viviparus TaxID=48416 RepID=A0AAW1F140_ZOAVI
MDSQKPINQLASELAALKEQVAAKELSWEQEKQKMMKALKSEIQRRKRVQAGQKPTEMLEVISSPSQSPNQDSPAEEVQVKEHQQTLSRQLQDLATAQPDSQKPDNQLVSEIAALKELMAAKELGWEQERQKIMKDLRSERELRKTAQADKNKTSEKEIVEVISSPSQSPNQDSPAEEVQVKEHQQTLSRQLQDLPTAQPDSQKPDNMLVSENAALKELMAAKELGWEQERQKIMKALRSERELRKIAQADKNVTEKDKMIHYLRQILLERQNEIQLVNSKWLVNVTEKDKMIYSLRQILLEKQNEIQLFNSQWSAKFNQAVESLKEKNNTLKKNCVMKAHEIFDLNENNVMDLDAKMLAREKENVTALKTQEENFDKKVRQPVLDLESCTLKDSELIRSEEEWKIKLTALEDQMRCELAAKEESFQREQELQRQSREMEDWRNQKEEEIKLLTQQNADLQLHNLSLQELAQQTDKEKAQFKKEEKKLRQTVLSLESCATLKDSELIGSEAEWKIKLTALEDRMRCELAAKEESFQREQELQRQSREMEDWRNQKEEEIKLLTQQNADLQVHNLSLQELAQQTDKEKAQFKKEEKKARKEAEEREKNKKKENEKREKEELKRQKKERKENEEREKEEVKRQKKENKLMEKREKVRT